MRGKLPPDRVCAEPGHKFFDRHLAPIRVSIDGVEFTGRVYEYNRTNGWARIIDIDPKTGRCVMFAGFAGQRPRIHWRHGKIVAWFADQPVPKGAIDPTKPQNAQAMTPEPQAQSDQPPGVA